MHRWRPFWGASIPCRYPKRNLRPLTHSRPCKQALILPPIDLKGNNPIKNCDLQVYWKSKIDSKLHPFVLGSQCGASSASYTAQSATNSSHTYSVQVPSETTIISREVLWSSTITFKITGTPANTEYLVNYGSTEAFAPFFLEGLLTLTASPAIPYQQTERPLKPFILPLK